MQHTVNKAVNSCGVTESANGTQASITVLFTVGDLSFACRADLPEQYTGSTGKRPHWNIWPSLIWNKKNYKTIEKSNFKVKL